jgi:HK97 gp10 family phage protein
VARKTYESRIEDAKRKIKEKPQNALREIGKLLTVAIRNKADKSKKKRTYYYKGKKIVVKPGRLKRSIGYWFRKKENDLVIGSKAFYAHWEEFGSSKNPKSPFLMPAIMQNKDLIQGMIMDALKELEKEE